jgi:hypothetical protein
MGSSSQIHAQAKNILARSSKTGQGPPTHPICRVHQAFADAFLGLCCSSEGSKIGVGANGHILATPPSPLPVEGPNSRQQIVYSFCSMDCFLVGLCAHCSLDHIPATDFSNQLSMSMHPKGWHKAFSSVRRPRHKEAYTAAQRLATATIDGLAKCALVA